MGRSVDRLAAAREERQRRFYDLAIESAVRAARELERLADAAAAERQQGEHDPVHTRAD